MGNCQAPEAVVIQHPGGREEQLYWPMSAADVMKSNPGYHVALVTLCVSEERGDGRGGGVVRLTRVRLLKPKDVLLLGQVYRLVTSQGSNPLLVIPARLLSVLIWPDSERPLFLSRTEVTMALRARKQEKLNKCQQHRTNDQVDYLLFSLPSLDSTEQEDQLCSQCFLCSRGEAGGEAGEGSAKERHADGSEGPTVASFSAEHRRSCKLTCADNEKEKEVYVVLNSWKIGDLRCHCQRDRERLCVCPCKD